MPTYENKDPEMLLSQIARPARMRTWLWRVVLVVAAVVVACGLCVPARAVDGWIGVSRIWGCVMRGRRV